MDFGDTYGLLILIAFVVIAVVSIVVSLYSAAQRRNALMQLCATHGWTFSVSDRIGLTCWNGFSCLCAGYSQRAYNIMQGQYGNVRFCAFDYRYTTGSGKSRQTHHFSAVMIELQYPIKKILIRPEGFGDRLAGMLGFEDIDFEWEEFNRAFYVKAEDKAAAYDVISQKMMEYLMLNRGWHIEISGRYMIVHNGVLDPDGFLKAMGFCDGFLKQLPGYLAEKMRSQGQ